MEKLTFFYGKGGFEAFGTQHLTAVLLFTVIGTLIIWWSKTRLNPTQQYRVGNLLSLFIAGTVILWTLFEVYFGRFENADLPIAVCNFSALAMPFVMIKKSYAWYQIFFFWIMAGTIQANLTPDLHYGFPHYCFFKYWIVHSGLIVLILYATIVYNWRPYPKSILKAFAALIVYFVFSIMVNYLTSTNHMYLLHKPKTASVLDLFGAWPWYVVTALILVIPAFCLVYIPFFLKDLFSKIRK